MTKALEAPDEFEDKAGDLTFTFTNAERMVIRAAFGVVADNVAHGVLNMSQEEADEINVFWTKFMTDTFRGQVQ